MSFNDELACIFYFLVGCGFVLGMLAMWGIPKLWHWLIPIIHAATG